MLVLLIPGVPMAVFSVVALWSSAAALFTAAIFSLLYSRSQYPLH